MQMMNVTWKWNVPNGLSLLRIVLIPVFLLLYLFHLDYWAFGVLLVSGLTDLFDGMIARRFHQVTDCGKLLDPLSDKLTQVAVVIALATRYRELLPLMVLCLLKESCQAVGGILVLTKHHTVRGSKWFGKASTVIFYGCMLLLVLFDPSPVWRWVLVALAGSCMLVAFIGYLQMFIQISRDGAAASPDAEKG